MTVLERIEEALKKKNLVSNYHPINPEFLQFETISEAIDNIKSINPDFDGIRIVLIKSFEKQNLPIKIGKYTISDLQKTINNLYEIHITEE